MFQRVSTLISDTPLLSSVLLEMKEIPYGANPKTSKAKTSKISSWKGGRWDLAQEDDGLRRAVRTATRRPGLPYWSHPAEAAVIGNCGALEGPGQRFKEPSQAYSPEKVECQDIRIRGAFLFRARNCEFWGALGQHLWRNLEGKSWFQVMVPIDECTDRCWVDSCKQIFQSKFQVNVPKEGL